MKTIEAWPIVGGSDDCSQSPFHDPTPNGTRDRWYEMDTSEIITIYMQRPGDFAHMGFGEWFTNALKYLIKEDFTYLEMKATKEAIIKYQYNKIPGLEDILNKYNLKLTVEGYHHD